MKVVRIIGKVIFSIVAIVYFAFALFMTILLLNFNNYGVTQFDDTSIVVIKESITSDEFKKGDVVIVKSVETRNINEGDTIFAYKVDANGVPHIQVGTVGEVYPDEDAISFENGDTYTSKYYAGTPSKVYHNIGTFLSVIESKWGFLFIVLVPCFLIFIYEIYALIVEIKYGADEN